MNKNEREKVVKLFDEMFDTNMTEARQREVNRKLDALIDDPNWSYYIFYDESYLNGDNSINYDKFFDKIDDYSNSDEFKRDNRIIELLNNLLDKNFSKMKEIEIVNEINELSSDPNWMQYIFVDKSCLNENGSVDEDAFLKKLFN